MPPRGAEDPAATPHEESFMDRRPRPAMRILLAAGVGCAMFCLSAVAEARITRIEITQTESPTFGGASFGAVGAYEKLIGRAFGAVGPYEKLIGRAFGEVDPRDPQNAVIADLGLAPRNARGMVEYDTGIILLRPVDPTRGNHGLFYELTNRGVILSLRAINES